MALVSVAGPLRVELQDYWVDLYVVKGQVYLSALGGEPLDGESVPRFGWIWIMDLESRLSLADT